MTSFLGARKDTLSGFLRPKGHTLSKEEEAAAKEVRALGEYKSKSNSIYLFYLNLREYGVARAAEVEVALPMLLLALDFHKGGGRQGGEGAGKIKSNLT